MNTCIYTRTEFEDASGEHILQNFLGARWTDSTIASNEIQQTFGDTIDSALAESLNGFRTLLGTLGGRGGAPPPIKQVEDQKGNTYHVTSGGQPELARPVVEVDIRDDGSAEVHIKLGNSNQLGWALHILKEEHPSLKINPDALAENTERTQDHLDSPLKLEFGVGGPDFFRGALKSIFNLLGASRRETALRAELDDVRDFIVSGSGDSSSFVGWPISADPIGVPRLGVHDHLLAVWSHEGKVDGYIQFFGEIPFVFRLATNVDCEDFCFSYLVNPHRDTDPAEDRNPDFDPSVIPRFEDCPNLPGPDLWEAHQIRIGRFMAEYQRRAEANVIHDIVDNILGPKDGELITQEDADAIHERLMKFVKFKLGVHED